MAGHPHRAVHLFQRYAATILGRTPRQGDPAAAVGLVEASPRRRVFRPIACVARRGAADATTRRMNMASPGMQIGIPNMAVWSPKINLL